MGKGVQTTLEECKTLRERLKGKGLSLKEGFRLAVGMFLQEEVKLDRSDLLLSRKPFGRSGRKEIEKS